MHSTNERPDKAAEHQSAIPDHHEKIAGKIGAATGETREALQAMTVEARKRLAERRESGELSRYDFDLNWIFQLVEYGVPLTRKALHHQTGVQAVVLTPEDLETLGDFAYVSADGKIVTIHVGSIPEGDVLILYPEDLGEEDQRPFPRLRKE